MVSEAVPRYRVEVSHAVDVRRARSTDASSLVRLTNTCALERGCASPSNSGHLVDALLKSPRHCVLVADSDGPLLGAVIIHWIPFPQLAGVEAYISDIMIAPESWSAGVAELLFAEAEALARDVPCVRLMINQRLVRGDETREIVTRFGFQRREFMANFVKELTVTSRSSESTYRSALPK